MIDGLQEFPTLPPPLIPGLLLPQPEPLEIGSTREYSAARRFLWSAKRLSIVGYSFGQIFGQMDDRLAYELVTKAIRVRGLDTIVLSPNAVDLRTRLQEDTKMQNVLAFPGYWHRLSEAIMLSPGSPRRKTCDHARHCLDCVEYFYEALLDARG